MRIRRLVASVVLLVVVGMGAWGARWAVHALDRRQGQQLLADLRTLATAVESYSIDENTYPACESLAALERVLVPTYAPELPLRDPWGTPYQYRAWSTDGRGGLVAARPQDYAVWSAGPDGVLEHRDPTSYGSGEVSESARDRGWWSKARSVLRGVVHDE